MERLLADVVSTIWQYVYVFSDIKVFSTILQKENDGQTYLWLEKKQNYYTIMTWYVKNRIKCTNERSSFKQIIMQTRPNKQKVSHKPVVNRKRPQQRYDTVRMRQTYNSPCCCCCCAVPLSAFPWSCPAGDADLTSSVDCGGGGGGGGAADTGCRGWHTYGAVSELDATDVIPITSRCAIHCFASDAQSTTASNKDRLTTQHTLTRYSHHHCNLVIQRTRHKISDRVFSIVVPYAWNWLTTELKHSHSTVLSRLLCRAHMQLFF